MASGVVRHFRSVLSGRGLGSTSKPSMGQARALRTVKAVNIFNTRPSRMAVVAQRGVTSEANTMSTSRTQVIAASTLHRLSALKLEANAPSYSLKCFVADHSGTLNDRFVIGPALGFIRAFDAIGVPTTTSDWRRNMGYAKPTQIALEVADPADPIRELERYPELGASNVRKSFIEVKGREPTAEDVKQVTELFFEKQNPALLEKDETGHRCVDILPSAKAAIDLVQARGLKTGGTTGFPRVNCDLLQQHLVEQGITLDTFVAPDDLPGDMGVRDKPHSMYENMRRLSIPYARNVVKVDDTPAGIGEARNAGTWTVGLLDACNHLYVDTIAQWNAMSEELKVAKHRSALSALVKARPHFIVHSLADIEPVLDAINFLGFHGIEPHNVKDTCIALDFETTVKYSKF